MTLPPIETAAVRDLEKTLPRETLSRVDELVKRTAAVKESGGKVVVATGSGPNLHEGVTTLIAELIRLEIVDGVTTSSAVIAHEMGGVLDRVKRVDGREVGIPESLLPHGGAFELSYVDPSYLRQISKEIETDESLLIQLENASGRDIVKAAGNLGYPMGLWIEKISLEILQIAQRQGLPFEAVVGWGADSRTMAGQGRRNGAPVLVTVPQLVGGGAVGLAIGDSVSISQRCRLVADLLESADVIIESGVALTQEIHDGPYETYTGHGLWAAWEGQPTFALEKKSLFRIDMDPNLEKAWRAEREGGGIQALVDKGLSKTKSLGVPFRMEMSGFSRLEGSVPIIGDLGVIWPIIAVRLADRLKVDLEFLSYPQETEEGSEMRKWIVEEIVPLSISEVRGRFREAGVSTSG